MRRLNQKGFGHLEMILVLVALVAVGLVGVYSYDNMKDNKQASLASAETIPEATGDLLTVNKIKELAEAQATDSDIRHIALEQEDGGLVYKVSLTGGSVLVFDAKTGEQLKTETEDESEGGDNELPADMTVGIEFDEALKIARAKFPGKEVSKVELEVEDGKLVYSVRFADKARVDVSAKDGSIVRTKDAKAKKSKKEGSSPNSEKKKAGRNNSGSNSGSGGHSNDDNGNETEDEDEKAESEDEAEVEDDEDETEDDNSGSNSGSGGHSNDDN